MMDVLRLAPKRFVTWWIETDQRPGMVKLRENRTYAREVAFKLVQEKRQELRTVPLRRMSLLCSVRLALLPRGLAHRNLPVLQSKPTPP